MKKIVLLLSIFIAANFANAQTKKDGTPDKRFKAHKEKKVRLKKDGTPDKRFKDNKEAEAK